MQELTTLRGLAPATPNMYKGSVNQPAEGYLNVEQSTDVGFDVHVLRFYESGGALKLVIQTASSATGPWKDLKEYNSTTFPATPYHDVFVASTRAGTDGQHSLLRFARWRVDTGTLTTGANWDICFRICATLK